MQTLRNLLLAFLLFPSIAFSEVIEYWTVSSTSGTAWGLSPEQAADSYLSLTGYPSYKQIFCNDNKCNYQIRYSDGSLGYKFDALKGSCKSGFVPDLTLRKCVEEEPEPEPDQCEAGNEAIRITYAFLSGNPNPPASICTAGCIHTYKGLSGVGMSEPTVPGLFKYWAKYESTETNCEGETPQEDPPPAPDPDPSEPGEGEGEGSGDPDPETPNHCPPGYSPGPNTDTCFKNPDPDNPGGDGDGNGSGDGDGSGNGSGSGNGNGSGDGDGSGNGNGNGDGDGDGSGNGNGTGSGSGSGSGSGEGEGEEEGDGEYKPGEGDSVCNAKPECSGDVIQCGIIDQQWRMRCDMEKAYDFEGNKSTIEGLLEGEKFELLESGEPIEVPSFLNMHARWLGSSSCPSDETISLRTGGGRTFSLSYEPLCTAATTISPLLIIISTVLATLYIGRGSEG